MKRKLNFIIFIILILITACTTYQSTTKNSNMNVSFLYNPGSTPLHPQFLAFNESENSSKIYFNIKSNELLFSNDGSGTKANIKIRYHLYNTSKNMSLCDSNTFVYHINKPQDRNYIIKSFNVAAKDSFNYFLDITFYDLNQDRGNQTFINLERKQEINPNDAIFLDKFNEPIFKQSFCDTDTFKIELRQGLPKKWYASWIPNKFGLRPTPYSLGNYNKIAIPKPDSIRTIYVTDTSFFVMNRKGIMQIYQDTLKNGFSVFSFDSSFPNVTTPISLLNPLRMLTSNKEYNDLNLLANKKEAVDKFWLDAAGNTSRARELIRVFYTRVKLANQYFTSYTEGWKTDRGLIYIVFGLPVTIYKAENIERWIYGTSQSNKTLVFNFVRQPNPLTTNDFILNRDEMYKISWTQAVDTWRNGKVYSVAY